MLYILLFWALSPLLSHSSSFFNYRSWPPTDRLGVLSCGFHSRESVQCLLVFAAYSWPNSTSFAWSILRSNETCDSIYTVHCLRRCLHFSTRYLEWKYSRYKCLMFFMDWFQTFLYKPSNLQLARVAKIWGVCNSKN